MCRRRGRVIAVLFAVAFVASPVDGAGASPSGSSTGASAIEVEPVPDTSALDDVITSTTVVDDVTGVVDGPVDAVDGTVGEVADDLTSTVDATIDDVVGVTPEVIDEPDGAATATAGGSALPGAPPTVAPSSPAEDLPVEAETRGVADHDPAETRQKVSTGVGEALGASASTFRLPAAMVLIAALALVVQARVLPPDRRLVSARTDRALRRFR